MENYVTQGHLCLSRSNIDSYNFDLSRMIEKFDLYDLCGSASRKDVDNNGAAIVITGKQYIVTFNKASGRGTHEGTFARIYKDLHGGGEIVNSNEAWEYYRRCKNEYITGAITYESVNRIGVISDFSGGIVVELGLDSKSDLNRTISPRVFESFKAFYNDYNNIVRAVCHRYNFNVLFRFYRNHNTAVDVSDSLDNLYYYLEKQVNPNIVDDDEDEFIVGKSVNPQVK